jgi:hypothetical protein
VPSGGSTERPRPAYAQAPATNGKNEKGRPKAALKSVAVRRRQRE